MALRRIAPIAGLLLGAVVFGFASQPWRPSAMAETPSRVLPAPVLDEAAATPGLQTAIFAGGCFWGVQAVFQHVAGVKSAVSGYSAEAVQVTFDPAQVSYATLLRVFFTVALDPTEVNRQGPDTGTQYRSDLFVTTPEQDRVARAYIAQLDAAHVFDARIATRVDPAAAFYPAEAYHQDYLLLHPDQPYIAINDMPKVRHLEAAFPDLWRATAVKVASGS
jgi:peptide-methionine (S)-S-oxide reductase